MRMQLKPKLKTKQELIWYGVGFTALALVLGVMVLYSGIPKIVSADTLVVNTWTGNKNNDFLDERNWSLGHVPNRNEKAIIDSESKRDIKIDSKSEVFIGELEVTKAANLIVKGSLSIDHYLILQTQGANLQVEGTLQVGGGIVQLNNSKIEILKRALVHIKNDITIENASFEMAGGNLNVNQINLRRAGSSLVLNEGDITINESLVIFGSNTSANKLIVNGGNLINYGYVSFQKQHIGQNVNGKLVVNGGSVVCRDFKRIFDLFYLPDDYLIELNDGNLEIQDDLYFDTLVNDDLIVKYGDFAADWNPDFKYERKDQNDVVRVLYNKNEYWLKQKLWKSSSSQPNIDEDWLLVGSKGENDKSCDCNEVSLWNENTKYYRENANDEIFVKYQGLIYRMNKSATITKGNNPDKEKWAWLKWYECQDNIVIYNDQLISNGGNLILNKNWFTRNGANISKSDLTLKSGNNFQIKKEFQINDLIREDGANLTLKNNLLVNGNIVNNDTSKIVGKGKLKMVGGQQQYLGGAKPLHISNLEIEKDSNSIVFSKGLVIYDSLIWTSTTLISNNGQNSAEVSFKLNAVFKGNGWIEGKVRKVAIDEFKFPVGDAIRPAYVALSKPSDTSTYLVEYLTGYPPYYNSLKGSLKNISGLEYWSISTITGDQKVVPTIFWQNANWSCIGSAKDLVVVGLNDNKWETLGLRFYKEDENKGSLTAVKSIEKLRLLTFGSTSMLNPLSTSGVPFSANKEGDNLSIVWNRDEELIANVSLIGTTNNNGFNKVELEKGVDELTWKLPSEHTGLDGVILEVITSNGKVYHPSIELVNHKIKNVAVYPNPFTNQFTVKCNEAFESNSQVQLELVDATGRTIQAKQVTTYMLGEGIDFNNLEQLNEGMYLLKILLGKNARTLQLVKK